MFREVQIRILFSISHVPSREDLTGYATVVAVAHGKRYSGNLPLRDGINDELYNWSLSLLSRIMKQYQPGTVAS